MTSRHQLELCSAAPPAAPEEHHPMVPSEMEAVEALASLARCSAAKLVAESTAVAASRSSSQGQATADIRGNASTVVTSTLNTEETVRTVPSKLCSASYQPNTASKLRKNLTEAEKEARRLRRVLANRESARQTIRRRQAMHLELTRKAANLSEEYENLKKEKELLVKEYNSLKRRNEFLKLQMANIKKAEPRETQEAPKSSQAEIATSATINSPVSLCNQSSLIPFFWPLIPSSNIIQLQYMSHCDVMSSSQFSLQHRDIPCSHLGQEISSGTTGPGNPLFVLPVPLLLPFPGYSTMFHSHCDTNKRQNEIPTHQCSMALSKDTLIVEDNHELSSNLNMWMDAPGCTRSVSMGSAAGPGFAYSVDSADHYAGHHPKVTLASEKLNCIRPVESIRPTTNFQEDNMCNLNATSATEHMPQSLTEKNPEPCRCRKSENVFAATKARRRRKELMRLKNIHCLHARTHSANY